MENYETEKNMDAYMETGGNVTHVGLARNEDMEKQGNGYLAII